MATPPQVTEVPFGAIKTDVTNMRAMKPSKAQTKALAEHIKAKGLISPVSVYPEGDNYQLILGFDRYYALESLEASELKAACPNGVPVRVFHDIAKMDEEEQAAAIKDLQLAENLNRRAPTPMETMNQITALKDAGVDEIDIVKATGKTRKEVRSLMKMGETLVEEAWNLFNGGFIELPCAVKLAEKDQAEQKKAVNKFYNLLFTEGAGAASDAVKDEVSDDVDLSDADIETPGDRAVVNRGLSAKTAMKEAIALRHTILDEGLEDALSTADEDWDLEALRADSSFIAGYLVGIERAAGVREPLVLVEPEDEPEAPEDDLVIDDE